MKSVLIFLILLNVANASELKVRYGLFNYELTYSEESLLMRGKGLEINLEKKDCNKKLILEFSKRVDTVLKRMDNFTTPVPEGLEIEKDKKKIYQPRTTPSGRYFLSLPEEMKKIKLREKLNCEK